MNVFPEDWSHEGSDERAGVDEEVEHREEALKLTFLLRKFELISTKSNDTWFDTSSSNSNQQESNERKLPENNEYSTNDNSDKLFKDKSSITAVQVIRVEIGQKICNDKNEFFKIPLLPALVKQNNIIS